MVFNSLVLQWGNNYKTGKNSRTINFNITFNAVFVINISTLDTSSCGFESTIVSNTLSSFTCTSGDSNVNRGHTWLAIGI